MENNTLHLNLLANALPRSRCEGLELRMHRFMRALPHSECLDDQKFSKVHGSGSKADYLLAGRSIVVELKTLNGNPLSRLATRLRERMSKPDAPIVYGTLGVNRVLEHLPDEQQLSSTLVNLAGRAVRKRVKEANRQIASIKERFNLDSAAGLVVIMNAGEPLINAGVVATAVQSVLDSGSAEYSHISHVWAVIEAHKVAIPGGQPSYPQLYILRSSSRPHDAEYVGRMTNAWGAFNHSKTHHIDHEGGWDAFRALHEGNIPTIVI